MSALRKQIGFGIAVLLVCLAAFLGYQYFLVKKVRSSIEAISGESMLVLHLNDPVDFWNSLVLQPFWEELHTIPAIGHAESMLLGLDSLAGQQGRLQAFLKDKNLLASLQAVGKDDFGWMFVLEVSDEALTDFWKEIESNPLNRGSTVERIYSDIQVTEIKVKADSKTLSVAKIDNLLLMSFNSFLVEEGIRNVQSESIPNVQEFYGDFVVDTKVPATIFLSKNGLQGILEVFRNEDSKEVLAGWPEMLAVTVQPKLSGPDIRFEGNVYAIPEIKAVAQGSTDEKRKDLERAVPKQAATTLLFDFEDVSRLQSFRGHGLSLNQVTLGELENKLIKKGFLDGVSGKGFESALGQTFADRPDRILVFLTDSLGSQAELMREFVIGNAESVDRAAFIDYHSGIEIFLIDIQEFPTHLFQAKFSGYENTYLSFFEDKMILANGSGVLRNYLDELLLLKENGREINRQGSATASQDSWHMKWEIDISNAWNGLLESVGPSWSPFFQKYGPVFLQFDRFRVQVSETPSGQKVAGALSYREQMATADEPSLMVENRSATFETMLTFGPKSLRNFNDGSLEFLIQDQLDRVYLITEEGEEVFSRVLDGQIVTDVFQIDYYKNEKLQLLFATANSLYAVDRLGEFLPGFPINISSGEIAYLNLVDYEKNLNYRYFLAKKSGEVFLLDREGKVLEGWDPKVIPAEIVSNPTHFRVPSLGDRMFVFDKQGLWHVFNRRGELTSGAPFRIASEITGKYAIREGTAAKETRIVTLSPQGEVVMANFKGEITERTQLPRPNAESMFLLLKDPRQEKYVIVIQEANQISVLDEAYQALFSQRMNTEDIDYQYFSFSSDNNILVLIDRSQEFIYLYDLNGDLLTEQPLQGSVPVEINFLPEQNEYAVYAIYRNKWSQFRLPL